MIPRKARDKLQKVEFSKSAKSSSATTMADLMAATGYHIPSVRGGQEVKGKVVSASHNEILVDIGAKSEGIIFGKELALVPDIAKTISVGDEIDAVVVYPENDAGQIVLSLRKHSLEKRWNELVERKDDGEAIDAVAVEANRGGLVCEWLGIRGFLPASQLAMQGGPTSQLVSGDARMDDLIGKTLTVRVIEAEPSSNRVIFSQKELEKQDLEAIKQLLGGVAIGEKYSGVVTAVLPFGLFVEIDAQQVQESTKGTKGAESEEESSELSNTSRTSDTSRTSKLEGLVHISEISWEKIDDVSKLFKVGDKVDVMVIAKDETSGRLSLSIKQLGKDPFEELSGKFSKDQEVSGAVSKVTSFGAFVTLAGGIDGLVPLSKVPQDWEVGRKVDCTIESIDVAARRIALSPIVTEKPILYR